MIICDPVGRRASAALPPSPGPGPSAADIENDAGHMQDSTVASSSSSDPSKGEWGATDPSASATRPTDAATAAAEGATAAAEGATAAGATSTVDVPGAEAAAVVASTADAAAAAAVLRVVWPAWDLRAFIVKSNDDLRQEVGGWCCWVVLCDGWWWWVVLGGWGWCWMGG